MPATILHISGPPQSGKTSIARRLAARLEPHKPHHVRLDTRDRSTPPALRLASPLDEMASSTRRYVTPKLVFEEASEVLQAVAGDEDNAIIFVETDTQPCFRYACPYDVKVFVMRPPRSFEAVFRSSIETVSAIERAMDDTSEFAAELFGLERDWQDSGILPALDPKMQRSSTGTAQSVEEFLESDIGAEIATRLHLQPEYHTIIDSDVILLNLAAEHDTEVVLKCAEKIEALLNGLKRRLGRQNWFAACDPLDRNDPLSRHGIERMLALLKTARTREP